MDAMLINNETGSLRRRSLHTSHFAIAAIMLSFFCAPAMLLASDEPAGSGGGSDLEEPAFVPPEPAAKPAADDADAKRPAPGTVHPSGAVELSIKPRAEVGRVNVKLLSDSPRPEWVEMDKETTKKGAVRFTVTSGPHSRMREARLALADEARRTTAAYIDDQLEAENATQWLRLFVGEKYNVKKLASRHAMREEDTAFVEGDIQPLHREQLVVSVGPMHQWYTRLEFDDRFHRELEADWQKVVATSRLLQFGFTGGGILIMLATMLGFFKANTATSGAHGRRLLVTGIVVVSALIAAGVVAARWLPWI